MPKPIGPFEPLHRRLTSCFAWLLFACVVPPVGAQASGMSSAMAITSISLERGCFGCATGSVLVLRRDGSATYTTTGNARHGTQDATSSGTVSAEEFERLASLVMSQRFFDLSDSYEDPNLRDGAWATTSVSRGAQEKRDFGRDDAGPAPLKAIETAIEGLRARIQFAAERR